MSTNHENGYPKERRRWHAFHDTELRAIFDARPLPAQLYRELERELFLRKCGFERLPYGLIS